MAYDFLSELWMRGSTKNDKIGHEAPLAVGMFGIDGRGGWIRTNGCRDQNPVPYHLATPLMRQNFNIFNALCQGILTNQALKFVLSFLRKWQG